MQLKLGSPYYTGGRASLLFFGQQFVQASQTTRENNISTTMNASVTWNGDSGNASGELKVGRSNRDSIAIDKTFKTNLYTVQTQGGSITIGTPAEPTIGSVTNMSEWLSSLTDETTHTLTGFVDEGLSFIGDFILEENFKDILKETHLLNRYNDYHIEPYIEIMKVYVRATSTGENYMRLLLFYV